ncbi:MAG: hypothetical protein MI919_36945, partial [Holophagales bacterium]|nr:hypothetical protein [Holophagales bacterium]
LADGEEFEMGYHALHKKGAELFAAMWTTQEGGGRPLSKGVGADLADPSNPLTFPRNFNRVSAPDANSCAGCHNLPRTGGGGDIVANVFVLGQRFDFLDFDDDSQPTVSSADERGVFTTLQEAANSRATVGMFGSGYIEMLSRQMTTEMREMAAALAPGQSVELVTKGVSFGTLVRNADGTWDTSGLEGLPPSSMAAAGTEPPSLILKPFHQVGAVTSLREFTNNAFNHHHGIQSTERFGVDTDPDGDGHTNEMSVAEVTVVSVYQATLPVPGRRIPRYRPIEEAISLGEAKFMEIGCGDCHIPELPLDDWGWNYTEPNPFNPAGNLQPGDAPELRVNLNSHSLPHPRLRYRDGVTMVPAFTDLKLHDITSGPDDPNRETLDQQFPAGSEEFFAGNGHFLTKKLWGLANEAPFYHHGKYTTMREAIEAHAGAAQASTDGWLALSDHERNSIIEFLKTLQVLPEDTRCTVIDEKDRCRTWTPAWAE